MDLHQKIRTLPTQPGCYLYKNVEGEVIYVGKAKNLRARVRSYFLEASQANAKTGSLMREAVDVEYITVANAHEALALENNLIKQKKPRFNILLRDDKTYPYIKLTMSDRYPKVFVTRRLRKDGSAYYGPYFPGNLAYRLVDLIHRSFLIPSCKVDLSRYHPRACLQYYIKRCLGPCVEGLTTPEIYKQTIRDVQLFLEGKPNELEQSLTKRMEAAAESEQFELAARLRDQIVTVHQMQDKQLYLDQSYIPRSILVPVEFPDRAILAELLTERTGKRIEILAPQRGEKRSLVDLVCQNARQSYDQRFRVLQPGMKAIQEALQDALTLEELPRRIECFDISHIQGAERVASMGVWKDGAMNKSDYRKIQVRTVTGEDDCVRMLESGHRRFEGLQAESTTLPT